MCVRARLNEGREEKMLRALLIRSTDQAMIRAVPIRCLDTLDQTERAGTIKQRWFSSLSQALICGMSGYVATAVQNLLSFCR